MIDATTLPEAKATEIVLGAVYVNAETSFTSRVAFAEARSPANVTCVKRLAFAQPRAARAKTATRRNSD